MTPDVISLIPAGVAAAGTAASIANQAGLFGGNKSSSSAKVAAAVPTRDTAADATAATQAEELKRRGWQTGSSSNQLTPAGGVQSDMTGLRMLSGAR